MQENIYNNTYFFVDESGDTTFYIWKLFDINCKYLSIILECSLVFKAKLL